MRKWVIGPICAALVIAAPQSAGAFGDGHALLKAAESEDITLEAMFIMYVAGIADGVALIRGLHKLPPLYCSGDDITARDGGDAVRLWLRINPQHLELSARTAVVRALVTYFPCETDRP